MGFVVHEFCTFGCFVVSKMLRFHWFCGFIWFCGFKCIVVSLVSALPGLGCFMGSFVFAVLWFHVSCYYGFNEHSFEQASF